MKERTADEIARILRDDAALDASLRAALAETVRRHRRYGVPLAVWRDGRVQEISPDDALTASPPARPDHP